MTSRNNKSRVFTKFLSENLNALLFSTTTSYKLRDTTTQILQIPFIYPNKIPTNIYDPYSIIYIQYVFKTVYN